MDYEQALSFIHTIARFGSKPGLRRVTMLLERMGNPQDRLKFIHVAGTNGKGSTCTMLSHILTAAGLRTGLYISPFVLDFRERIQVNNQMISKEDLVASTALVKSHWDVLDAAGETPTEFEVVVAIAMDYFVRQNCDVVVLEVGMGGRFDATNVIQTPLASVITSIDMDHIEYLGDTLEKIAFEKCGIIKEGGITVSYPHQLPEAMTVIQEQAAAKLNTLMLAPEVEVLSSDITGSKIVWRDREIHLPLAGRHQVYNASTVLATVEALALQGLVLPLEAVVFGIAATRFPSRLEILHKEPLVLLDGAHNLSGAQALADALALLEPHQSVHGVVGMLADKDVDGVLAAVLPRCSSVVAVTPNSPRALDAKDMAEKAKQYCSNTMAAASLEEGVHTAFRRCGPQDVVVLFGSLYLASDLRPIGLNLSNTVE